MKKSSQKEEMLCPPWVNLNNVSCQQICQSFIHLLLFLYLGVILAPCLQVSSFSGFEGAIQPGISMIWSLAICLLSWLLPLIMQILNFKNGGVSLTPISVTVGALLFSVRSIYWPLLQILLFFFLYHWKRWFLRPDSFKVANAMINFKCHFLL